MKMKNILKGKSKLLLVSFIIGLAYLVYLIVYFGSLNGETSSEQIGQALATAMVMPHIILVGLAVIFNGLGCFLNKRGFALTGAILYAVAMIVFIPYFMFVIIEMILSFVGFAKMKKPNKETDQ